MQAESEDAANAADNAAGNGTDEAPMTFEEASETIVESIQSIVEQFLAHLPLLVSGVIILIITALIALVARRVTQRLLRDVKLRQSLKELLGRFAVLGIWALGLLLAAMVMFPGLTPSRALTALGVGSIAIGLAFKDIFENFFAGVLILWRFPIENGDWITCNGITGRVVDVTIRNTMLRTTSGELVVMPNSDLYKNPVDVLTNRDHRRIEIICGVAYGESVGESRQVIEEAVRSCSTVSKDQDVQVFAQEFADSSVNFEIAWWTGSTPLEQRRSRDEVVEAVKTALDDAGIEIPFPYRTHTFKEPVKVEQSGAGSADAADDA